MKTMSVENIIKELNLVYEISILHLKLCENEKELEDWRKQWLGKDSYLGSFFKWLGDKKNFI
jgi:hypothetical protein